MVDCQDVYLSLEGMMIPKSPKFFDIGDGLKYKMILEVCVCVCVHCVTFEVVSRL